MKRSMSDSNFSVRLDRNYLSLSELHLDLLSSVPDVLASELEVGV